MKTLPLVTVLIAAMLCIFMAACTSKPKEKETPPAQPVGTMPTPAPTPVPVSNAQPESTVKNDINGVPVAVGSGPQENNPQLVAMLKRYPTWPPASIKPDDIALLKRAAVIMMTSKGTIKIKVFPESAPINSANFVKLASEGFYNNTVFHRVIKGFMSQGGDPTGTGQGGPTPDYTLPAEIKLPHEDGSVAAARQGDQVNPQKRSSGSQFYMCHSKAGCAMLDGKYTVFGKIMEGQQVNLALNVTYNQQGPIPGATPDKIVKAWVILE
jgi:cyclophilin family peptidyl-prolyl cis-trans isomerase